MHRGCQAGREYRGGRPHGAGSGRWQLRFVCSRRVSHRDPRSVPRPDGHSGPAAAAERSGQGRLGGGAARPRLPPARSLARSPAPRAARSAPPPPGNLVSGSRRRSPIGRLRAPRHNGAAPGRRAGQRRGFPLRRSRRPSASAGRSARPGRAARAPGGSGRQGRWGPRGPGGEEGDAAAAAAAGGGPQGRCGYLAAPHLGVPQRAGGTVAS